MISSSSSLPLFYDSDLLNAGMEEYVLWDYSRYPHLVIFGSTGTGKSYAVQLLLARIGIKIPRSKIFLCDFKSQDFSFLQGFQHYYQWMDVGRGITEMVDLLHARQQGIDSSNDFRIIAIDELASLLNSIEKKEAEKTKLQIASLLMLGRSFNIHVLVSQQRPDASYFAAGARDNFNLVISLGNLSKEAKQMFAFDDDLPPLHKLGAGYMLTNNTDLKAIQVPKIRNMDKLRTAIKRAVE